MVQGVSTRTIGVVIPVYGRQDVMPDAIASVLKQSRPADQIVVVDDGSPEPVSLPDQFRDTGLVTLIRLDRNAGPAAARQAGVDRLQTSHVAFLDSDDVWLPGKLAAQFAMIGALAEPEKTAVACGWRYHFADGAVGEDMIPIPSDDLLDFASGCWFSPGSTVIMPVALLKQIGGYDSRLRRLEDLDLFIRFALDGGKLAVAPIVGAIIRKGGHARVADVEAAADHLAGKYLLPDGPLNSEARRRLTAWLALERAAAHNYAGNRILTFANLMKSVAHYPRLSLHLKAWWVEGGGANRG